jgi:hypothetical protein
MSTDNEVMRLLGQIDGKLDSVVKNLDRHIDDDVRRFSDVYGKLEEHAEQISRAKGAKAMLLWLVGGGAAAIGAFVSMVVKAKGGS